MVSKVRKLRMKKTMDQTFFNAGGQFKPVVDFIPPAKIQQVYDAVGAGGSLFAIVLAAHQLSPITQHLKQVFFWHREEHF
jgi:hypothetical protein